MTQDEIIEFGKQAGLEAFYYPELITKDAWEKVQAFAKLVAIKEREACARVCDELQDVPATEPRHCAEDIRARGEA